MCRATLGPAIVTVGNFDGVHRGHQAVLERMVADGRCPRAGRDRGDVRSPPKGGPRPRARARAGHGPRGSPRAAGRRPGWTAALVIEYTLEFALQTPDAVCAGVPRAMGSERGLTVVVGQRHSGLGAATRGTCETMRALGQASYGFAVEVVDDACATSGVRSGAGHPLGCGSCSTRVTCPEPPRCLGGRIGLRGRWCTATSWGRRSAFPPRTSRCLRG